MTLKQKQILISLAQVCYMDQMTPFDSVKYQSFNKKKKKKNVILLKKRKRTNTYVYIMKINLFNATIYGACEGCGLLNCK